MLGLAIASFLICIPLQFYYAFTNLFLNQGGVSNAAGKMTGGQISEVICMILIPWFFRRLGVKYMLAAGMLAWIARYIFFAYGNVDSRMWMLWAGNSSSRNLLRLLLCHRADLYRPKGSPQPEGLCSRVDHVHHLWHWNVCWLLALRGGGESLRAPNC